MNSLRSIRSNAFNTVSSVVNTPSSSSVTINKGDAIKIGLLVIILAILGFNVFVFIARGTEWAADLVERAGRYGLDLTFLNLQQSVKEIDDSLNLSTSSVVDLENALGAPSLSTAQSNIVYQPDRTTSDVQRGSSNRRGYCYIGKDKGFRSCIYSGVNDVCESNEIYPTMAKCRYPKQVRA